MNVRRILANLAVLALAGAGLTLVGPTTPAGAIPKATGEFNYGEALQKAIWFYDAQREGRLPADNRVPWRGDSFLSDGADVSLDLVGGFADAGDHIKASFPLVHSLGALAWGMIENPTGYSGTGQDRYLLSNLRWGMDYLLKANPSATRLVTEVADPNKDHQVWASAEVQTYTRDTYVMNAGTCWGADLADSAAATFAAASMVFKASDPTYAANLLTHARQLWSTTESATKAKYDDCTPIVKGFYNSWSGYADELVWGSLWLYRATGEQSYLDKAKAYYPNLPRNGQSTSDPIKYSWTYDWDDKTAASFVLLAKLTGDAQAVADATRWADFNAGAGVGGLKVSTSPGGEAFYGTWGSLRYSSGAAFLAFILADSGRLDATRNGQLHDFAVRQINYILGDNPSHVSYMVGFGSSYIKRPHHRTAHGPWSNSFSEPVEDRHTLYGGLIGGPTAADDNYGAEDRNAFQKAEVALDYNAAFTGALARMQKEYGGAPLASLPDDPKDTELYMTASLNQAASNFVEIKTLWYNHTAWPARFTPNITFRYYFTLDAGQSISAVQTAVAYAQCATPGAPTLFSGNVYYVTISCVGQNVGPVGQSESRRENQFRITFPGPHDYTKDWSYAGVSPTQSTPATVTHIPMYDGNTLVWGTPPGAATPPGTPGTPVASNITSLGATLNWTASATPGGSPIASYDIYRVATGGDVKIGTSTSNVAVVSTLNPATAYTLYVKAVDSTGATSAASGTVTFTTLPAPTPPGAPGRPTASNVGLTSATISWTAATAGTNPLSGYNVTVDSGSGLPSVIGTAGLSVTVNNLAPSTTYTVSVKAVDTTGVSGPASPSITVTTGAATPPTAPGTPTASNVTGTQVTLAWTASTPGSLPIGTYEIYRQVGTTNTLAATVAEGSPLLQTITGLQPGVSYRFTVLARDTAGTASPVSGAVTVVTPSTPPAGCTVTYRSNPWPGGFTTDITVKNGGTAAINGWSLAYTLPSGQVVTSAWNTTVTPTSGAVTARNTASNGTIAPGGTVNFGYQGTYTGTYSAPTSFTLNGNPCTVA